MDRFLDAIDPVKKAQSRTIRNNLRRCRARIAALSQPSVSDSPWHQLYYPWLTFCSQGRTIGDTLSSAKDLLSGDLATFIGGTDADLIAYLDSEKEHVDMELERCRTQAKTYKEELESLWAESTDAEYELCSVITNTP
jgi:ubiquitin carboxyl-terminal hydrolase 25/28